MTHIHRRSIPILSYPIYVSRASSFTAVAASRSVLARFVDGRPIGCVLTFRSELVNDSLKSIVRSKYFSIVLLGNNFHVEAEVNRPWWKIDQSDESLVRPH